MKKMILALLLVCGALGSVSTVSAARRYRRGHRGHHRRRGFGHGGYLGPHYGYGYGRGGLGIALGGLSGVLASSAIARSEASHEDFRRDVRDLFDKMASDIDALKERVVEQNARLKVLEGGQGGRQEAG